MPVFAVAVAAFLPGIIWLAVIYRSDRYQPEPRGLVLRTFLLGVVLGLAFALGYSGLPFVRDTLIALILVAPVVEEGAKFLLVRWTVYESAEFNEPLDGVVYACSAALGFAAVENVAYSLDAYASAEAAAGVIVLLGRAVLSVPGHALFSSMWGMGLGLYRCSAGRRSFLFVPAGLLAAMAAHSAFNVLVRFQPLGGLGLILLVALLWRFFYTSVVRRALAASPSGGTGDDGDGAGQAT